MQQAQYLIPRFLDHPKLYPVFTLGESLMLYVPILLGWFITKSFLGFACGMLAGAYGFKYMRKFKEQNGGHVIARFRYWCWPQILSGAKAFPPSNIREYVG